MTESEIEDIIKDMTTYENELIQPSAINRSHNTLKRFVEKHGDVFIPFSQWFLAKRAQGAEIFLPGISGNDVTSLGKLRSFGRAYKGSFNLETGTSFRVS